MFKNIFLKTLYEKRWGLLGWSGVLFGFTLLTAALFPTFKDFGNELGNASEAAQAFIGGTENYTTFSGYIDLQVMEQFLLMTIIYGVILGTGLLAGDESEGRLQTLLAQPVSRTKVFMQKLAAGGVLTAGVTLSVFLGVVVAQVFINESLPLSYLLQGMGVFWITTMVFTILSYSLGAITGKRGIVGAIVGLYAFACYIVTPLTDTVSWLEPVSYASILKYYNDPSILMNGARISHLIVLLMIGAILAVAGWFVFNKRDIAGQ